MKHLRRLAMFAIMVTPCCLHAQQMTTKGTDFWVAFLNNWKDNDVDTYKISVSGLRTCTATISNPLTGWSSTLQVNANQVATCQIPASQCYQPGSCILTDKGIHVLATDTVSVSAFNYSGTPSTCDAALILPVEALASEYVVQTYPMNSTLDDRFVHFCVLAVEDSVDVDIILSGPTSTGLHAGDTISVRLNAGQVFQVQSPSGIMDFSGTRILAHDCKHVAVFTGGVAKIPYESNMAYDHLFCQNWPAIMGSQEWIITPEAWHNQDYVRVTALADGCTVRVGNAQHAVLSARQTYEFAIATNVRVETSQPALVYQYLPSRTSGNQGGDFGDAAMFAPDPTIMRNRDVVFTTYSVDSRGSSSKYYVNIVVPTSESSLLRLDNQTVSTQPFPNTLYSCARVPISSGTHRLTTTGSGFTAFTYGLGENWEGYAYNLGGHDTLGRMFYPNSVRDTIDTMACGSLFHIRNQDFIESGLYVLHQSCDSSIFLKLQLYPEYHYTIDSVLCDSLLHWEGQDLSVPGQHRLEYFSVYGCDSIMELNLTVADSVEVTIDSALCDSIIYWGATPLAVPGNHTLNLHTQSGCDSILHVNLTRNPSYTFDFDTAACEGYLDWNGRPLSVPGTHRLPYVTQLGCDSIVNISIAGYPTYDTTYYVSIVDTQSYVWINGHKYTQTIDTAIVLVDQYGCDSVLRLSLLVNPTLFPPEVWVPNVFTPRAEQNQEFRIVSNYVDRMTVTIFDRQGDKVCTFDGLTECWDGTHKGTLCQQGAYVYRIDYESSYAKGTLHPIVGTVLLLR